jgi:MscS family membrane protein
MGRFPPARPNVDPVRHRVRYETSPEQLRYLLVRIREALLGHPKIQPDDFRVRFVGFGASSLDTELFAYMKPQSSRKFLGSAKRYSYG